MTDMADRLIVALDVPTVVQAEQMVELLEGQVSFFKIGLWLAFAEGFDNLLRRLTRGGNRVFLDTKMNDIPRTVEEGAARAAERGVAFITVHNDWRMMSAAVRGAGGTSTRVLAITTLTSQKTKWADISSRAKRASDLGCAGVIASAIDLPDRLRVVAKNDGLLVVTPGIRYPSAATDDHARTADPETAIRLGADYLVVGRPIIAHDNPMEQAQRIVRDMLRGETVRVTP